MKKALALVFTLLLILSAICGCNVADVSDSASGGGTSRPSDDTSVDFDDRKHVSDSLPEADYGGAEFTILERTEYNYEFGIEDIGYSTVNDLIYERDAKVEERFGVTIKTQQVAGDWGVHEDFIDYVRNTIAGGTCSYDLIAGYAAIMPSLIAEGCLVNWYDVPYVDLNRDWWSQDFIDEMTVNGQLYLLAGDLSLTFWESMQGMFFNKDIASDAQIDDLYQTVRDGEWTFDAMLKAIRQAYNEDSNEDSRIYGYCTFLTTQIDVYQDAFDIPVTVKGSDGRPYFAVNCEKTYNAVSMIYDLVWGSEYTYVAESVDDCIKFFGENRALFCPLYLNAGSILNSYDCNYGILPMPKYSAEQENYNSTCKDSYSVFAIPDPREDKLEYIGTITEALCAESYRNVVPEWYTVILQNRYTTDEDSIEMIEIIRKGILCNFGYLYSYALEWPAHQLNICINNRSKDFASQWEASVGVFEKNLKEQVEYYFDN